MDAKRIKLKFLSDLTIPTLDFPMSICPFGVQAEDWIWAKQKESTGKSRNQKNL